MKTTLSIIKADVGSIGGHVAPSRRLVETIRGRILEHKDGLLTDHDIASTGDDIVILMAHGRGVGNLQLPGLLRPPRPADRAGGPVRPPVLGGGPTSRCPQGGQDLSAGLLRGGDAPGQRTGIRGDHPDP